MLVKGSDLELVSVEEVRVENGDIGDWPLPDRLTVDRQHDDGRSCRHIPHQNIRASDSVGVGFG